MFTIYTYYLCLSIVLFGIEKPPCGGRRVSLVILREATRGDLQPLLESGTSLPYTYIVSNNLCFVKCFYANMPIMSKKTLRNKADMLASRYYRAETPYCELSGKDTVRCGGVLQWMHIISRSNLRLRYEPFNKLIGCAGHHIYYTHNPLDWVRFLEQHYPERLALVERHRHEIRKIDYSAWIDRFNKNTPLP